MDYNLSTTWTVTIIIWAIWELSWKGFALWHASNNGHRNWFIALLFINSIGMLPMIYLLINYHAPDSVKKGDYRHEAALPIKG